mgnify:CR=1 FL=1
MSEKVPEHGGELSITHHANRQEPTKEKEIQDSETGGEDTVHLALGVHWENFEEFFGCLAVAKEQAIENHGALRLTIRGRLVAIKPKGKKSGGGRGMYYPICLNTQGFTIWLSEHASPIEQTPNVLVEMGSALLMSTRGLMSALEELVILLGEFGGQVLWDKISRIDLCADLPNVDPHDLIDLVYLEQTVCRARIEQFFRESGRWRGIQVGRGELLVRIYDKFHEVTRAKPDPIKLILLERYRWGGPQETASRVEFQLRREAVKSLGVDTASDYLAQRDKLVAYLCESWFRLVDSVPDRENNNTQRAATHPLWLNVTEAFRDWAGHGEAMERQTRRPFTRDPIRLVKQGFGCLLAAVSDLRDGEEVRPDEFAALVKECIEWNLAKMSEIEFYRRYHAKALPKLVERPHDEK